MSPETVVIAAVEKALAIPRESPLMVGLCGAQGSGKSTLAAALARHFSGAVALSLDDFYCTRAERMRLAAEVHPLLATRGVPGTHDLMLAQATFAALDRGEAVPLPKFDKGSDDRVDPMQWPVAPRCSRVIFFEGWCVGAQAQSEQALVAPINRLEREEDQTGLWRRRTNAALESYQPLFARIDQLILLRAPDWDTVLGWRLEQEHALRRSHATGVGIMDDAAVARFVSHYERLTRHILDEMPCRADLVLELAADRTCVAVQTRAADDR